MTPAERAKPAIINPKRKRRIAAGSGTSVEDVNKLLRQFEMMQKMMKKVKRNPKGFMRRGNATASRLKRLWPQIILGMTRRLYGPRDDTIY